MNMMESKSTSNLLSNAFQQKNIKKGSKQEGGNLNGTPLDNIGGHLNGLNYVDTQSGSNFEYAFDAKKHQEILDLLKQSSRVNTSGFCWTCFKCFYKENPFYISSCTRCNTQRFLTFSLFDNLEAKLEEMGNSLRNNVDLGPCDKESFLEHKVCSIPEPWSCRFCGFLNVRLSGMCDLCERLRVSEEDLDEKPPLTEEQISNLKWNFIVSKCILDRKIYVDESFPPTSTSLYYSPNDDQENIPVKWLRVRDSSVDIEDVNYPWSLFCDLIKSSDVYQGELGDCWLVSALTVLVEKEYLVRNAFVTKFLCPQGVYEIRLCKDGMWMNVLVDDLIPCDNKKILLYSQAVRKQLWVPLIEKAVAKIHGCYEALTTGTIVEGLSTLTGAPCENIPLQPRPPTCRIDADFIWAQLVSSRQALFLMGCVSGGSSVSVPEDEYEKMGIHSDHVYSIMDLQDICTYRLLLLRDPYGLSEWNGDWSPGSSLWTADLQREIMPQGLQDGAFWISFEDFLKYFDSVGICRIRDGWSEIRLEGIIPPLLSNEEVSCVVLNIYRLTEVDIILYQDSQREIEMEKRTPVDLLLILFKKSNETEAIYTFITSSKRQVQGFVGCYSLLDPGEYIIFPLAFNHTHRKFIDRNPHYVLAIHSSNTVSACKSSTSNQVLADIMISFTMAKGGRLQLLENLAVYYLTESFGGSIIIIENRSGVQWVEVKCSCDKRTFNITSTRNSLKTLDYVPALHRQVIGIFTQCRMDQKIGLAHLLEYRFVDWLELLEHFDLNSLYISQMRDALHGPRFINDV